MTGLEERALPHACSSSPRPHRTTARCDRSTGCPIPLQGGTRSGFSLSPWRRWRCSSLLCPPGRPSTRGGCLTVGTPPRGGSRRRCASTHMKGRGLMRPITGTKEVSSSLRARTRASEAASSTTVKLRGTGRPSTRRASSCTALGLSGAATTDHGVSGAPQGRVV